MQVLMTGGAGFIGCSLIPLLQSKGHEVVVLDNLHPQVHTQQRLPERFPPGVRFIPGDVTSAETWRAMLADIRPQAVFHLAAETGTGQSLTEAHRHASVNVLGTARMTDAFVQAGHIPERIILTSSRAVYGDGAWAGSDAIPFYPAPRSRVQLEAGQWNFKSSTGEEASPLPHQAGVTVPNPASVYGATKLTQEQMLQAWCRAYGTDLRVLRLQNVYGAGQSPGNPYTGVLTFFATRAVKGEVLDVYEDGEILRDFVHVRDVSQALLAALEVPSSRDASTLDIGSGQPTTILEVAREMSEIANLPKPHVSGRFRDGDVRAASCSIDAARSVLGYRPRVQLKDGLMELLDFVRNSKE